MKSFLSRHSVLPCVCASLAVVVQVTSTGSSGCQQFGQWQGCATSKCCADGLVCSQQNQFYAQCMQPGQCQQLGYLQLNWTCNVLKSTTTLHPANITSQKTSSLEPSTIIQQPSSTPTPQETSSLESSTAPVLQPSSTPTPQENIVDCVAHGTRANGTSACFFAPDHGAQTWAEAEAVCVSYGGNLASVLTKEEEDIVYRVYTEARTSHPSWASADQKGFWIGAADSGELIDGAEEGRFLWSGSATDLAVYQAWAPGEPNNWQNQDCCAVWNQWVEDGQPSWGDTRCDSLLPFVCGVRADFNTDVVRSLTAQRDQLRIALDEASESLTEEVRSLTAQRDQLRIALDEASESLTEKTSLVDEFNIQRNQLTLVVWGLRRCVNYMSTCYEDADTPPFYSAKYAQHCVDEMWQCEGDALED